jgi:phospholipid/cholesterol/gamma-HCH transport system ATP-binding protein
VAKQRDAENSASLIVSHRYQDGEIMANFRFDRERQELVRRSDEEQQAAPTNFIVMKDGEIVFSGSRTELEASSDAYVKRFIRREG